jgi:hypothetical protein
MTHFELNEILEQSGIRHNEAACLFRVAPSTLYRWLEGKTNPKQPVVYEVACKLAMLIRAATQQGLMPVHDVKGKARLHAIRTAVREAAASRV